MNRNFEQLTKRMRRQLSEEKIPPQSHEFRYTLDLRHKGQINEIEVPLADGTLTDTSLGNLYDEFFRRYESIYGKGSSFRGAGIEAVTFRVRASAATPKPRLTAAALTTEIAVEAELGTRPVYWTGPAKVIDTPAYKGESLVPGNRVPGPAVIETSDTTVVIHPGRDATIDAYGNVEIELAAGP